MWPPGLLLKLILAILVSVVGSEICTTSVCEFELDVRWGRTMVYRSEDGGDAYNVIMNGTKLQVVANSYRVGDPRVGTTVSPGKVHTGDGYPRTLIVINGQFPGPTLEVMEGAQVVVKVINNMETEGITVHWHGMRQHGAVWMDGVPYVTQCPIMPHQSFRYRFTATPAGTHWYHSHFRSQRIDGLHGLLIVHKKIPVIPEFSMIVSDWYHVDSRMLSVTSPFDLNYAGTGEHEMKLHGAEHLLFYGDVSEEQMAAAVAAAKAAENKDSAVDHSHHHRKRREHPLTLLTENKKRSRRTAHAGDGIVTENTPATKTNQDKDKGTTESGMGSGMSMDMGGMDMKNMDHSGHSGHGASPYSDISNNMYKLSGLINGKGRYDNRKMPLTTYTVSKGQTYRFRIVNSGAHLVFRISIDQHKLTVMASDGFDLEPREYESVMVFPGESMDVEVVARQESGKYWIRSLGMHGGHNVEVLGIFTYGGDTNTNDEPVSNPNICSPDRTCWSFNCPDGAYPGSENIKCVPIDQARSVNTSQHRALYASESDEMIEEYFLNLGFNYGPSINAKKFKVPSSPMHQTKDLGIVPCPQEMCKEGCECTHIRSLGFNRTVQFILANYDPDEEGTIFGHHSTHLHGHSFAVLKLGYPDQDPTSGNLIPNTDVDCGDKYCSQAKWRNKPADLNLENPPIKDTVIVPSLGYAVVQFRSDNPGFWLLHCHVDPHSNGGMAILIEEAREKIQSPPENFPSCKHFDWPESEYEEYNRKRILLDEYGNQEITLSLPMVIGIAIGCVILGVILTFLVRGACTLMTHQRKSHVNGTSTNYPKKPPAPLNGRDDGIHGVTEDSSIILNDLDSEELEHTALLSSNEDSH